MPETRSEYIGDGVYASFDGYHINLAVNHHENHAVAIEAPTLRGLIRYAVGVFGKAAVRRMVEEA